MPIIIDASVVIACVTGEAERDALLAAVDGHLLIAPASLPWEVGNALSAGFKRGRFSLDEAAAALELYQRLPIDLRPVDLTAAIRVAHAAGIYAYDAYMLQCAVDFGGSLLTLDRRLRTSARALRITVVEIAT